jgi:aminoglycoside 3-N-acetyltransferase
MTQDPSASIGATDIVGGLRDLGVSPGMTLLVHSSLSSLGHVEGAEHTVIDALIEAIGPTGLLTMPTHTHATVNARQPVFHELLSPSCVGRATETFRRRPGVVRSLHPTHSVGALGIDAAEFVHGHDEDDTPCSRTSPYGRLVERKGSVLLIGVGLERFTLMHGFEEWADVPWLFNRTEELWTITADQRLIAVPSRRHTNDPRYHARNFPALEPALQAQGAIRLGTIGAATVRLIDAAAAATCLIPIIRADPSILLPPPQHDAASAG